MAGVALGVYVVGIPVLFGGLLWRYRARVEEQKVRYWLGNLYYCYKRKYYWFEMVILVRRLLLAVLISVLPSDSIFLPSLVLIALSLALLVQLWLRPFALKVDNRLESISIATILITFVVQYLLFINGTATSTSSTTWEITDTTRDALTGGLVIANLGLMVVMLMVLFWPFCKWIWKYTRLICSGKVRLSLRMQQIGA